jgi:hypothetical protein
LFIFSNFIYDDIIKEVEKFLKQDASNNASDIQEVLALAENYRNNPIGINTK